MAFGLTRPARSCFNVNMSISLASLRHYAVARSLFEPAGLHDAIRTLGFVQADPIRAPARAQDLILRHRVAGYRAGDLERHYPSLPIAEGMLHVYGFLPHANLALLHPCRLSPRSLEFLHRHRHLCGKVLGYVRANGEAHPRELESAIGKGSMINGWGSSSSATTLTLEALHRRGSLRVVRRDAGIRIYGMAEELGCALAPQARADGLVQLLVGLYAPAPERSLRQMIATLGHRAPRTIDLGKRLDGLVRRGELRRETVDGVAYVWPANENVEVEPDACARLLAPFDPIVWDRRRFESLWGWNYRFEAYTPPEKRKMGYYALPLLWREDVVGWASVSVAKGNLVCEPGLAKPVKAVAALRRALEAEVERMAAFLKPE